MNSALLTEIENSIANTRQQFDTVSVNLERLIQTREVDPKDYVKARTLIGAASVSAHKLRGLLKKQIGVEEEEVILTHLELINNTLEKCRSWELL